MGRWDPYRLGDAIRGHGRSGGHTPFIDVQCARFPGSIVCDYRFRTKEYGQTEILAEIVQRRGELYHNTKDHCQSLPPPNTTVVHLRLGDVAVKPDCFVKQCKGNINHNGMENTIYMRTFGAYNNIHGRNICVMTNTVRTRTASNVSRHKIAIRNSELYLRDFIKFAAARGKKVYVRNGCLPDEDFVYAAHSSQFIKSGGGYSKLMAQVHALIRD